MCSAQEHRESVCQRGNIPELQQWTDAESPCGSAPLLELRAGAKQHVHCSSHQKSSQLRMVLHVSLIFLWMCSIEGLLLKEQRRNAEAKQGLGKAILEMLHIKKVSASHQAKPHPYMKRIYQHLESLEPGDFGTSDGILVQSFRSVDGKKDGFDQINPKTL